MGKKRIIVEVNEEHYRYVTDKARAANMTVANYARRALHLPLERQGVKGTLSMPAAVKVTEVRSKNTKQKPKPPEAK